MTEQNQVSGSTLRREANQALCHYSGVGPLFYWGGDMIDQDLIDAYEERAAIMEYDGGLGRGDAERLAALERVLGIESIESIEIRSFAERLCALEQLEVEGDTGDVRTLGKLANWDCKE